MIKPKSRSYFSLRNAGNKTNKNKIKANFLNHNSPEFHLKKTLEKIETKKTEFKNKISQYSSKEKLRNWGDTRNYKMYDNFFKKILNKNILSKIRSIPRKKGKQLVVLEDGPGYNALFLDSLKTQLNKLNISSKTIALSLNPSEKLKAQQGKAIDILVKGPAEKYLPKEKIDLIVSLFGSIHYTLPLTQKNHLLKLAHSLNKGGVMLVGFSFRENFDVFDQKRDLKGIIKALKKRGFKAKFKRNDLKHYYSEKGFIHHKNFPEYMLLIEKPVK